MISLGSEWSSRAQIGSVKKSLLPDKIAHTIEIQNTLPTIEFIYTEKKVSAPSPHHKIRKNRDTEITLIEIGIEKKSFFMVWNIQWCQCLCFFFLFSVIGRIINKLFVLTKSVSHPTRYRNFYHFRTTRRSSNKSISIRIDSKSCLPTDFSTPKKSMILMTLSIGFYSNNTNFFGVF